MSTQAEIRSYQMVRNFDSVMYEVLINISDLVSSSFLPLQWRALRMERLKQQQHTSILQLNHRSRPSFRLTFSFFLPAPHNDLRTSP